MADTFRTIVVCPPAFLRRSCRCLESSRPQDTEFPLQSQRDSNFFGQLQRYPFSADKKERLGNQGVPTPGAPARFGQFFPLAEKKAAFSAAGWKDVKLTARALKAQPEMLQMPVHLTFWDAEPSGKLPGGKGFFFEGTPEALAQGCSSFLIGHRFPVSHFSALPFTGTLFFDEIFFPDSREKIW